MADLSFLDSKHPIYGTHEASWKREEQRLEGGDAVLGELVKFAHEETPDYTARQGWARWTGFGRVHTTLLAGHLTAKIPTPSFGDLGEIRPRGETDGNPSLAELFYFNCDGVGTDGQQLPAFMDGVEQRALATGFRWLLAEMPTQTTLQAIRARMGRDSAATQTTEDEVREGFRPYLVEYSPLAVTNWRIREGVLCWAVIRIPVEPKDDLTADPKASGNGFYLLVRAGYEGLGPDFKAGGWWKFDAQKQQLPGGAGHGDWSDTGGQIPLWMHVGEPGRGTYERPSIGQSSTMELGQISADLMNAVSEQRYNLRQAAKSINYWMGMETEAHSKLAAQSVGGSIQVAVPETQRKDGNYTTTTLANSSASVLDAGAYEGVIQAGVEGAKEIMVRQIVAAPNASGARVEAEHQSATSPMLARIAGTAEQSWNTMLYFVARRFGLSHEQAAALSVEISRDFELRSVLDDIDAMLDTITKANVEAPKLKTALVLQKAQKLDLIPPDEADAIGEELGESGLAQIKLQAEAMKALIDADADLEAAAEVVGFTPEQAAKLFPRLTQATAPRLQGIAEPGFNGGGTVGMGQGNGVPPAPVGAAA